jgi:hypothetical protein
LSLTDHLQSISISDRHPYYSPAYINGILQRKGDTMNKSLADMQGFPAGFPSFPSFPQHHYPAVPSFYQQSHQPFGGYGYGQPFSQAYSPLTTPSAMYSSYPYTSDFFGQQFSGTGFSGHSGGFSIPATHVGGFSGTAGVHGGFRY